MGERTGGRGRRPLCPTLGGVVAGERVAGAVGEPDLPLPRGAHDAPPTLVFDSALCGARPEHPLVLERSDGHRSAIELGWWRAEPSVPAPPECRGLDLVADGPVLDAWCRTGRRMELLAARGHVVRGIDTHRGAVALGQRAGRPCEVARVDWFAPPLEFGTVLALGAAVGTVGRLDRLPDLLGRLAALVYPGGAVLVGSVDWRVSTARHARFVERQRRDRRYPGDVRLRLRYGPIRSEWFEWVWVDRDALAGAAARAGLTVAAVRSWRHRYVARLVRQ